MKTQWDTSLAFWKAHWDAKLNSVDGMGQAGQLGGAVAVMIALVVGVIMMSIVAIVYNGIDKSTLIGGARSLGDQLPLIAVAIVLVTGVVGLALIFVGRRG